jgi:hypothetical protein
VLKSFGSEKKKQINYVESFTLNEVKSYIQLLGIFLYTEAISFGKLPR